MLDKTKKRYRLRIIIPGYPEFNIYSRVAKGTTALGPVCVASVANKMEKWDVEIIDENNLRRYGPVAEAGKANHEFLQDQRPADVVGLYGGLTSTIPRLYKIASFYKSKGAITIAGGQHFVEDNIKEALNSSIDYIVKGEGEKTIKELLRTLEKGEGENKVKGIAYKKDGDIIETPDRELIEDFDKFPLPDFSLVRYAKIKMYPVGRIRGCGMNCEFCTVKGRPRYATPERLLETISKLLEIKDARHFFIIDDLFGQQRKETIRFCNMLEKYQKDVEKRLDFVVQIRLDKAKDHELLSAMRKAGINTVAIGFESPIKEELEAMNKHIKTENMVSLARTFHNFGFLVHGMFIFGYPLRENVDFKMSVEERIKRYRKFIKESKVDTVQILLPVPLPGTELTHRLKQENRIYPIEDIGWQYYDGNFPLFEPDEPLTAVQLQNALKKIMGGFYKFKYVFSIVWNIFHFPAIVFFLHNIKRGWRIWYRRWRNHLVRFGGWIVMKEWETSFKKGDFPENLEKARQKIKE